MSRRGGFINFNRANAPAWLLGALLLSACSNLFAQADSLGVPPTILIQGVPDEPVCSNAPFSLVDASFNIEGGCADSLKRFWAIGGSATVLELAGELGEAPLGDEFDFDSWDAGSAALELMVEGPGDVVVTLFAANPCGYDSAVVTLEVLPGGPFSGLEALLAVDAICEGEAVEASVDTGHENDTVFWSVEGEPGVTWDGASAGWSVSPFDFASGPFWNDAPSDRDVEFTFWRSCGGPVTAHVVEVHPEVSISVDALDTACTGTPWFALVNADVHGINVGWTVDAESPVLGAQAGSGPFVYDPLENTSDSLQSVVYTFTTPDALCPADTVAFEVFVAPPFDLPQLDAAFSLCTGDSVEVADYSIDQEGVTYGWTYEGDAMGIPDAGVGVLEGVSVENGTQEELEGTLHLEAYFLGCTNQIDYDIIVLPTPQLGVDSTLQAVCSNVPLGIEILNGVEGVELAWEVLAAPAISGANSDSEEGSVVLEDTLVNAGSAIDTVRYVFTTPAHQCPAVPLSLTLLVAPDLSLMPLDSQRVCNGEWIEVPGLELPLQGVEYGWQIVEGGGVGLDSSGTGLLPSWWADLGASNESALAQVRVGVEGFGCADSTDLVVEVEPIPVIALSGWSELVCSDVPLEVEVGVSVSEANVVWDVESPAAVSGFDTFGGSALYDVPVNSDSVNAAVNVLFYTEGSFCAADSVSAQIAIRPSFQLPDLSPAEFCNGAEVTAPFPTSGVAGVEHAWLNSNADIGLAASGTGLVPAWTVEALAAAEATIVQVASYADCPNDTSVWEIQVHPTPELTFNVGPNGGLDCQTGLAVIEGFSSTGFGAFSWSGPGNVVEAGSSATVDEEGAYVLNFVDDATGCLAADTAVVASPTPIAVEQVAVDSLTCFGINDGSIEVFAGDGGEAYFEWSPPVSSGPFAGGLGEGTYWIWATNASNCVDSVEVELVSPEVVQVELVDSSPSICGVSSGYVEVAASGGLGAYTYDWGVQQGERLSGVDSGVYEVQVTDGVGCTVFETFEVTCAMELPILVNQLMTPNADGFNDRLVIEDLHLYPGHRLQVFNRWGGLVYEAAPYANDWEGTWEVGAGAGQPLPSATYYFLFETGVDWVLPFRGFIEIQNPGQ